ncbi:MAG: choice-of-anchor J domain-containing protein [Dehalococcoidia bacterium]
MIITALLAVLLCAFTGIALDVGRLYVTKAQLSRAVDAAALAGVLDLPDTDVACATAETYFQENEGAGNGASAVCTSPGENQLRVKGSKSVEMTFLKLLSIDHQTVSASALAGFGVVALDAAVMIDSTGSMDDGCNSAQDNSGCPIHEAKEAAKNFKDILLGSSPDGQTAVGAASFRGCYRANPQTATAPKPSSASLCPLDDGSANAWVSALLTNSDDLGDLIDNIEAEGGSGTNVCGGLAKGWEILEGPGNHLDEDNNLRYLIILSDGDNNYYGQYTYQGSPYASPHTYQGYPCQPPSSCSNVGGESSTSSNPCHNGVNLVPNSATDTVASDNWTSSCNNWSTGSGWVAAWTRSTSPAPSLTSSGSPNDTSCHARLGGTSTICRPVTLSGTTSFTLSYRAKDGNTWDNSSDNAYVEVSTSSNACSSGGGFTNVKSHTYSTIPSSYTTYTVNLDSYAGQTVYIRFRAAMNSTSDYFYIDTVLVSSITVTMVESAADGYVNGFNGSPASCSSAVKRERQVDMLTWALAKAIKADDVEIFTVGFGVCDPNPDVEYTLAECDAQIGNTDHDNIADERLLKCMATSEDHYYYASSASELPTIFSQIAKQIGHRLIE